MPEKVLLVGKSESGKTTLAHAIAASLGKNSVAVNDDSKHSTWKKIKWSDLETQPEGSTVVVEDLIACSERVYKLVLRLLTFSGHHSKFNVIVICHSLTKNNVTGLLDHWTKLYFTLSKTNRDSISKAMIKYNFDKEDRDRNLRTFDAATEQYGHFILDPEAKTFVRGDSRVVGGDGGGGGARGGEIAPPPPPRREDYMRTAEMLLAQLPDSKRALAVFSILIAKLELNTISPHDLSITLYKNSQPLTLSLVDYLHALSSKENPSGAIVSLHRYVRRHVVIPAFFLSNKALRDA
jgi:hypothetical protein